MEDEQLMAVQDDVGMASVPVATEIPSGSVSARAETTRVPTVSHELSLCSDGIRSLVGVELPIYGSNMTKVLETVGGLHSLQQAHETKSQFLPVKLRPTEPSCKPLFADLTKTQMILLRVKRSRPKRKRAAATEDKESEGSTGSSTDGSRLKAEVVGLVREKYVCEGMADFQYLTARPLYPTPMPTKDTIIVAEEEAEPAVDATPLSKPSTRQLELQASLRPYLKVEKEEQLELIPEVFSKVDLPLKYEFRQRSGYLPTAAAKKPSNTMSYLNFHDDAPAPAGPKPDQPVLRRRSVGVEDNGVEAHVLEVLQTKLERKPVWLRSKLFEGLDALERRAARRLLRKLCYVFVDGPWRGSWIRMGYDPRAPEVSDTASRYQVIELRNNRELVHSKVTHPTRKRTKKFVTASSGNANGDNAHVKGPRIVKVTQTSALENAQASKRRRKERFTRGETRRSYLVEPTPCSSPTGAELTPQPSPEASVANDWDSENELQDKEQGAADASDDGADDASSTAGTSSTVQTTSGVSEKVYEIFGVQLTSANVLFQLDEIDDDEVREWMAQFVKQSTPSLLGGWYPTQMFLPLREIIRLRIAALVGRSKAELESRRKRLDALKKQALSDYADELAGNGRSTNSSHQKSNGDKGTTGSVSSSNNTAAVAEEDEDLAFERSLIRERNAGSNVAKLSANDGAETGEEEDGEDDIESQEEEDDDNSANGRSRAAFEEDEDDDDQEEEEEAQAKDATLDKQQDAEEKNSARETDPSTSPAKPTTKEYSF